MGYDNLRQVTTAYDRQVAGGHSRVVRSVAGAWSHDRLRSWAGLWSCSKTWLRLDRSQVVTGRSLGVVRQVVGGHRWSQHFQSPTTSRATTCDQSCDNLRPLLTCRSKSRDWSPLVLRLVTGGRRWSHVYDLSYDPAAISRNQVITSVTTPTIFQK